MATSIYTIQQRIFIVQRYYMYQKSLVKVIQAFCKAYDLKDGPAKSTIRRLINKFKKTGNVADDFTGNAGRPVTVRTEENIEKTRIVFQRPPQLSIRRAAQQIGINRESLQNIIVHDLSLFPYKIQTHQPLSYYAVEKRLEFAKLALSMMEGNKIGFGKIWFSDEARFHLDGFVNKQNWRIWGTENPHFSIKKSLHPQRVTVWCAISEKGIIGPFFIDGNVTSLKYVNCLQQNFIPKLHELGLLKSSWFMQDGARPHRTFEVFKFLNEHFDDRVIALDYNKNFGKGINWPPYSPDLNPSDYFLWGCIKDKVYINNPQTIEELKISIQTEIEQISKETLKSVIQNFIFRLRCVIKNKGTTIEYLIT
jgi:hypothetical protein